MGKSWQDISMSGEAAVGDELSGGQLSGVELTQCLQIQYSWQSIGALQVR